jgi:hypothetical protein
MWSSAIGYCGIRIRAPDAAVGCIDMKLPMSDQ